MASKPIVVIGSSNIDLVAKSHKIPIVGETLTGTDFFITPGGKGANQAVAAAKSEKNFAFIAFLIEEDKPSVRKSLSTSVSMFLH